MKQNYLKQLPKTKPIEKIGIMKPEYWPHPDYFIDLLINLSEKLNEIIDRLNKDSYET